MAEHKYNWYSTDKDELAKLSDPDPEWLDFLRSQSPFPEIDFSQFRQNRELSRQFEVSSTAALGPLPDTLEDTEVSIPLRDAGQATPARLVRPSASASGSNANKKSPLIVLVHGGGYTLGSELQMVPFARRLSLLYNAVVVTPTYRLTPEHPFPIGILDAWDALKWCAAHAAELGADPQGAGFIVGGVSAGGNFASVLTQLARDRNLQPPVTGQWTCIPGLQPHKAEERKQWFSREQNADASILNLEATRIFNEFLKPDLKSPLYSPLNSEMGLGGTPRTYVQVCGADPLRDDGFIYAKALEDAGVEVKVDVYPGLPHGFWTRAKDLRVSKKFYADVDGAFAWLLKREVETV